MPHRNQPQIPAPEQEQQRDVAERVDIADGSYRSGDRKRRVDQPLPRRPEVLAAVIGFDRVEIDPRGFRSGSMNELLPDPVRYR